MTDTVTEARSEAEPQIRPLTIHDCMAAQKLLNIAYATMPYSRPLTLYEVQEQLLGRALWTHYPMQWREQVCLGAWQETELVGLIDIGVGFYRESYSGNPQIPHEQNIYNHDLDLLGNRPIGILRNLTLPDETAASTGAALLNAAHHFWQGAGVDQAGAFHPHTGYPPFQAGIGILSGDCRDLFQALAAAGYVLGARYYRLRRLLEEQIDETLPLADLQLVYQGSTDDRTYQLYWKRTQWIGQAHLFRTPLTIKGKLAQTAHIGQLHIDPTWRRQRIGKWLLHRLINDATLQGYSEMLIHIPHDQHATLSMLVQQGFQELNYRGYSLSKWLKK